MKHIKQNNTIAKQKQLLRVLLVLLGITLIVLAVTLYRDYQARPGVLKKIWVSDRGADYITVSWEKPRNVYKYVITYNDKTISVSGMRSEMRLSGLSENTEYEISVRADSKQRNGFEAVHKRAKTKKSQSIEGERVQMKFANKLVSLKQKAKTDLVFSSDNKSMKIIGDKVIFTKPGKYVVSAKAEETDEYVSAGKTITVNVLDSIEVDADGATPHTFFKLNKKNCTLLKTISGVDAAPVPQSFEYVNGEYVVLYINAGDKSQRIISFGDKKKVTKPQLDFGHCNGLTFVDGRFYMVKSGGADGASFDSSFKDYNAFTLPYDASGIGYDRKTDMIYTSQYNYMTTYDKDFRVVNHFRRIIRSEKYYSQDGGAYGGIMMHCVSGADYQGTNYIDFYDMLQGKYLGTIECALNEVESLIVDDDGYIQLLCNTTKNEDCIWKTPINMEMLCN